jgi:hypothetical protein
MTTIRVYYDPIELAYLKPKGGCRYMVFDVNSGATYQSSYHTRGSYYEPLSDTFKSRFIEKDDLDHMIFTSDDGTLWDDRVISESYVFSSTEVDKLQAALARSDDIHRVTVYLTCVHVIHEGEYYYIFQADWTEGKASDIHDFEYPGFSFFEVDLETGSLSASLKAAFLCGPIHSH